MIVQLNKDVLHMEFSLIMKLFCSGQIVSVGDPTRKYTKMEKIGQG